MKVPKGIKRLQVPSTGSKRFSNLRMHEVPRFQGSKPKIFQRRFQASNGSKKRFPCSKYIRVPSKRCRRFQGFKQKVSSEGSKQVQVRVPCKSRSVWIPHWFLPVMIA